MWRHLAKMGFKEGLAQLKDTLLSQENPQAVFPRQTEEFLYNIDD